MAKASNLIRPDVQWQDYAIVSDRPSVVNLPDLSAEEIHEWVIHAYRSFYLSPAYLISRLKEMRSIKNFLDNLAGLKILRAIIGKH